MRILVLCTGNSCRSQMAEGLIRSFGRDIDVYSAGTDPADHVHPKAVSVMDEIGIDISHHRTKTVDIFLNDSFDYVITVCDDARENCPVFAGDVKHRLHIGFPDPAKATGTEEEIMNVFREVRDNIYKEMRLFVKKM